MKPYKILIQLVILTGLILTIFIGKAPMKAFAQETTVLLFDDFNGDSLDTSLWTFNPNSYEANYFVNNGELQITSGYTPGGGGVIRSTASFYVYPDILVLEIRAKTSNRDGGNFAWMDTNLVGRIAFLNSGCSDFSGLQAGVYTMNNQGLCVDIPNIQTENYHIYRIEYTGGSVRFFVDNILLLTQSDVLVDIPMRLQMDRVSWGIEEIYTVDYVKISSLSSSLTETPTPSETIAPTSTETPTATPTITLTNTETPTVAPTITPTITETFTTTPTSTLLPYNFMGFFQPVDNLPTLNAVNAGRAIPVKFSLGGNQGLDIFVAGYPTSAQVSCGSTAADSIRETLTAGASSLSYNASSDQYTYVWKTEKSWAGTCRTLVVRLDDGTYHLANFKFK